MDSRKERRSLAKERKKSASRSDDESRPTFRGADADVPSNVKIKVRVKNVPRTESSVVRGVQSPERVVIVRRFGEGSTPLFNSDKLVIQKRELGNDRSRVISISDNSATANLPSAAESSKATKTVEEVLCDTPPISPKAQNGMSRILASQTVFVSELLSETMPDAKFFRTGANRKNDNGVSSDSSSIRDNGEKHSSAGFKRSAHRDRKERSRRSSRRSSRRREASHKSDVRSRRRSSHRRRSSSPRRYSSRRRSRSGTPRRRNSTRSPRRDRSRDRNYHSSERQERSQSFYWKNNYQNRNARKNTDDRRNENKHPKQQKTEVQAVMPKSPKNVTHSSSPRPVSPPVYPPVYPPMPVPRLPMPYMPFPPRPMMMPIPRPPLRMPPPMGMLRYPPGHVPYPMMVRPPYHPPH